MILRELTSGVSRSYLRFAFFNAALDSAFKKTRGREKKLQLTQRLHDEGQLILDSKRTRSAISFRPLPFAFLDGERVPLTRHLRDKATRGVEGLHARLHERARYSDILISGSVSPRDILASSPRYTPSSWNLLSALNLRSMHPRPLVPCYTKNPRESPY